jgi:hypothetical protein
VDSVAQVHLAIFQVPATFHQALAKALAQSLAACSSFAGLTEDRRAQEKETEVASRCCPGELRYAWLPNQDFSPLIYLKAEVRKIAADIR